MELPLILFDTPQLHRQLQPLTLTRSIAELRIGIRTIREQWEDYMGSKAHLLSDPYLQLETFSQGGVNLYVRSNVIPSEKLVSELKNLKEGDCLRQDGQVIAFITEEPFTFEDIATAKGNYIESKTDSIIINRPWDLFRYNGQVLEREFDRLANGQESAEIHDSVLFLGDKSKLFIHPEAKVQAAILNTETGPIYIGKDCEVMEGSFIRGPFAMIDHAVVKMGAKIYGPTTLGNYCKVGGELNNVILQSYSNKGHDGFLGNSVIGSWCNLGADTNCSNLKNNYGEVRSWSYQEEEFVSTGLQFCGLIMGDHSKSSINAQFNTGTICGVSSNIFDSGFPSKHIPSFSWGGGKNRFDYNKSLEVAERMMERRGKSLSDRDRAIMAHIYKESEKYY